MAEKMGYSKKKIIVLVINLGIYFENQVKKLRFDEWNGGYSLFIKRIRDGSPRGVCRTASEAGHSSIGKSAKRPDRAHPTAASRPPLGNALMLLSGVLFGCS
jgi:hypothetical protein